MALIDICGQFEARQPDPDDAQQTADPAVRPLSLDHPLDRRPARPDRRRGPLLQRPPRRRRLRTGRPRHALVAAGPGRHRRGAADPDRAPQVGCGASRTDGTRGSAPTKANGTPGSPPPDRCGGREDAATTPYWDRYQATYRSIPSRNGVFGA